ncbi:MAG: nitroreductase family protein [Bacteroidales bacterium]|nr:nitroreductase family protein [Bacteroidales bacterium]
MDTIFSHRSIRKYKSINVPDQIIESILKAAIRASTTGNMQLYSIIVTKNEEIKKRLWEVHFKQNMVLEAPLILTFCADLNRFEKWCIYRDAKPAYRNFLWFMNATIDALLAAQNAALEAEYNGLGICYLGTTLYNADQITEILNLPDGVIPVTSLVVGYPDESPELTDRLPLEAVVHYETYKNYTEEIINSLYEEKENSKFYKDLVSINNVKTLAHVFTEKRYTEKDNIYFSEKLIKLLKKQHFI